MTDDEDDPQQRAAATKRQRAVQRLAKAAVVCFEDFGLETTVEQICEQAMVSVATFYKYFDNRNHVAYIVWLLDNNISRNRDALRRAALIYWLESPYPEDASLEDTVDGFLNGTQCVVPPARPDKRTHAPEQIIAPLLQDA